MRTFIAIPVPVESPVLKEAADYCRTKLSGEKVSWVDLRNIHITLFFLGDTDPGILGGLSRNLETIASTYSPISIRVKGMGYFGSRMSPRVLWAGVDGGDPIVRLRNDVQNAVVQYGFEPEDRNFSPHVTLARIKYLKRPDSLFEAMAKYCDVVFQELQVDKMVWMESVLTSAGAVYKPLKWFPFGKK